jgi:hypothetical protein
MRRALVWSVVVLLLGAFAAVAFVLLRERAALGRGMPDYSVYSEGDEGLGVLARLLQREGWQPVALTRPIPLTPYRGLLVVVEPQRPGLAETRALLHWVAEGNTLLWCERRSSILHRLLNVTVTEGPRTEGAFAEAEVVRGSPYTAEIDRLSVGCEATLTGPRQAAVLWRVKGRPGALLLEHGRGRVLLVADPTLLTQRGLVRADGEPRDDNALFALNVVRRDARGGEVFFDAYHHGLRAGTGFWSYLGHHGRRWALLPVLVVAGVALWRVAVRLGPAVPRPRAASADAVVYASALGRLYRQAGARRLPGRVLVRDFVGALTRHLRLRRTALPALLLSAWRQQEGDRQAGSLQELLRGVGELRKGEADERRLLHWARAFDEFTKEMQGTAKSERKAG